ncbi:hypothetical protein PMI06_008957 [Burkholderia sp. BT03]|jgi:hypothetical protein|nr:hypothetical protein PMI06_008957 [Burkholderia sp. BT03]SKC55250.1 hypothetical protein SAMN06266956_0712 [Paraburkholderia hospita]
MEAIQPLHTTTTCIVNELEFFASESHPLTQA